MLTITVIPITSLLPVEINCLSVPSSSTFSYKRNKRQFLTGNFATSAMGWGTYSGNTWTQPVVYRRFNEDLRNIRRPQLNAPVNYKPPRAHGTQILNRALDKKKNLLQYLNNPSMYAVFTKPFNQFTSLYPSTKGTLYPIMTTTPITLNTQPVTTLKPFTAPYQQQWSSNMYNNFEVIVKFMKSLDSFERKFYKVTFTKLSSISAANRRENGISFVQSGLFLQLALLALSSEVDDDTSHEIEECINLNLTHTEKMYILKEMVSMLPKSSDALKFRLSTRLVVDFGQRVKPVFQHSLANALKLHIDRVNNTDTPENLTTILNKMIEKDSGGGMRDTFEEEELSEGICAVLLSTMYLRPRWRSSPTVLNGTHAFLDTDDAPTRFTRMIRINDIVRYAELHEWDAEAIEIFYATPGLSLLIVVPRGRSLRKLSTHLSDTSIHRVLEKMYSLRVAISLPLYTLRMTLLLPSKLQSMGISRLVDVADGECNDVRLSHAVQRLMFWAEAGRNAFKDDGIEWDEEPELELVVNRPYIFFVRWRNITIMNGNFVL